MTLATCYFTLYLSDQFMILKINYKYQLVRRELLIMHAREMQLAVILSKYPGQVAIIRMYMTRSIVLNGSINQTL